MVLFGCDLRALDFFVNFLWGIPLFFFPAREMEWGGCKKSGEGGEEGARPCNYRGGPDYREVVAHVAHTCRADFETWDSPIFSYKKRLNLIRFEQVGESVSDVTIPVENK